MPKKRKSRNIRWNSGNLYDFQFAIDGEVKSLPSRIQEWIRQGWEYPEEKQKAMLETDSYIEGEVLKQGEKQLTVDLVNLEGKETQVMDCYVGGITLTYEKTEASVSFQEALLLENHH